MQNWIELRLPDFSYYRRSKSIENLLNTSETRLGRHRRMEDFPATYIGFEIRAAYHLIWGSGAKDYAIFPRVLNGAASVRGLFSRPSFEAIFLNYQKYLMRWDMGIDRLTAMNSALQGKKTKIAGVRMQGSPGKNGVSAAFEHPDTGIKSMNSLQTIDLRDLHGIELAGISFAMCITNHVFSDGNGRLSRFLLLAGLINRGNILSPSIPVNLLSYMFEKDIEDMIYLLSQSQSWDLYMCSFIKMILQWLDLSHDIKNGIALEANVS